jgi:thermostable 8-oxoguanine DNA glycosylase
MAISTRTQMAGAADWGYRQKNQMGGEGEFMKEYDIFVTEKAFEFLLSSEQINEDILCEHLQAGEEIKENIDTLDDVFYRLMISLQNANMKAKVIGGSLETEKYPDGILRLRNMLIKNLNSMNDFENEEELLRKIFNELNPNSSRSVEEHVKDNRSIWYRYVKSLFSAKAFLEQFSDLNDFKKWIDFFDHDNRARSALPMILSEEIYGMGFALACDFLKEIGYTNFGKPDVHIKDIFYQLGLSQNKKDYFVLKDIVRVAEHNDKSPYYIDKLFWLIGSGNFYLKGIKIKKSKKQFIDEILNSDQFKSRFINGKEEISK